MSEEIEFTIDEEGNVTIEAKNYKGKGCLADIMDFEKELGKIESIQKKAEYFQPSKQKHQDRIRE